MWFRKGKKEQPQGHAAYEEALGHLENVRSEREEVERISGFLRGQRIENHLSARIATLLREGR